MNTTTTARKTATVTLDLGDNDADNYVDGVACHDCVMLVANGEVDTADPAWDMDAALATQGEHTVAKMMTRSPRPPALSATPPWPVPAWKLL